MTGITEELGTAKHPRLLRDKDSLARQNLQFSTVARGRLATGDAFVHQDFVLNPTVFGSPCCCLVRCRRSVFAHRARCHDAPHWHAALLDQISDHRFSAFFAIELWSGH